MKKYLNILVTVMLAAVSFGLTGTEVMTTSR